MVEIWASVHKIIKINARQKDRKWVRSKEYIAFPTLSFDSHLFWNCKVNYTVQKTNKKRPFPEALWQHRNNFVWHFLQLNLMRNLSKSRWIRSLISPWEEKSDCIVAERKTYYQQQYRDTLKTRKLNTAITLVYFNFTFIYCDD